MRAYFLAISMMILWTASAKAEIILGSGNFMFGVPTQKTLTWRKKIPVKLQGFDNSLKMLSSLSSRQLELGVSDGDSIARAYKGLSPFSTPIRNIQTMALLYQTYRSLAVRPNFDLKKTLKKRSITVAARPGIPIRNAIKAMLTSMNIPLSKVELKEFKNTRDASFLVKNKKADVVFMRSGTAKASGLDLLPIPKNHTVSQHSAFPAFTEIDLGFPKKTKVYVIYVFLVTHNALATQRVEQILTELNMARVKNPPRGFEMPKNKFLNSPPIPYHPTALAFHKKINSTPKAEK